MPNKRKPGVLISVIVPVYRVEDYLFRCVDSLVKQTYKNLEIILVDDGSPDRCGELCDDWAKKDARIKVIHKKNGGLSSARNAGLDVCRGEYIIFVDSDDYLADDAIEYMYADIQKTDADISICDFVPFSQKAKSHNTYPKKKFIVSGKDKWNYIVHSKQHDIYGVVTVVQWNKLFKAHIFKKLRFQNGKVNEDEFIIADELGLAEKISYNLKPLYYYLQRDDSIIHSFSAKHFDGIDAYDHRINYFKKHNLTEYIPNIIRLKITHLAYLIGQNYHIIRKNEQYKTISKRYINENAADAKELLHTNLSRNDKIRIRLLLSSPRLLNIFLKAKAKSHEKSSNA